MRKNEHEVSGRKGKKEEEIGREGGREGGRACLPADRTSRGQGGGSET
jgi:hypothetical protein